MSKMLQRKHKKKGGKAQKKASEVSSMLPADYRYINKNLSAFWSVGNRDKLLDNRAVPGVQELHNPVVYYEFGNLSLVQKNDRGDVEGYLIGYLSPKDKLCGVVHAHGLVEAKRSPEAARGLFVGFENLCAEQGCNRYRVLVNDKYEATINFYLKLGFSVDSLESKEIMAEWQGTVALIKDIA